MNRRASSFAACWVIGVLPLLCASALAADAPGVQAGLPFPDAALDRTFDCSRIKELGYDKQNNMHATLLRIQCGLEPRPEIPPVDQGEPFIQRMSPSAYGGTDVNTITGTETYPAVTQSESFVWAQGQTVVVTYNDSRTAPGNYSGGSYSVNGGTTFTRLTPSPFASGHGTNYGDPTVVFDVPLNTWYASFLATGCGGQGIGIWTSPDGITWSAGACAHNGGADDRQSMWVDNNAASPYYGRMYISWNDFAAGQGIYCVHSDNGTVWTNSTVVSSFIRNVQLTGGADGTVFVAGMNENGGGFNARTNLIYRSTNGGTNWTAITMGAPFAAAGSVNCGYFVAITPIWRHMGWGQPGVGPSQVVHYPFCGRGVNAGDVGDIYYTRSIDNGTTWSTPIVLNSDQSTGGTREQWMPSVSVTAAGTVFASWYDRRGTSGTSYEFWGRLSTDNGVTWQPDMVISDVISPQPLQPDPNVQSCYVGDYNYHSALGSTHYMTWCDGRVQVSGNNQQDVWFDKVTVVSCPTITLSPASLPNGTIGVPYSQTITASGGTAPYTFAVTAGALPPGLALNGATGVISGIPTTAGSYNFTITATDANSCTGSQAYTIDVSCPLITVLPATLPNGTVGVPYSQTFTASGGTAPYTFAVTGGALPAGLALNGATGVLSGTPTAAGASAFTITATDAVGCAGVQQYALTIDCPIITLSPGSPLPNGTVGVPYSVTISASGGTAPYTFAVTGGALPAGLALNGATGVISGTPTTAGTSNFTVTATDAFGCTGAQAYDLTVDCPAITLAPGSLPNGVVGVPYSQTIAASGGTAPYTFAVTGGALPTGLALNGATGVLSGTPTTAGTYNFTITATDANGCSGSQAYTIVISACAITLSPPSLPIGAVGFPYSQTITASGGTAPYTFAVTAGALPPGLALSAGGILSGTPTTAGSFNFTVTATDSASCSGSQPYTIVIGNCGLTLSPTTLPNGTIGVPYSQTITASGGTAPYTFAVTAGALPGGLALSAGGILSGTPNTLGTFNFIVTATDSTGCQGGQAYTIVISVISDYVVGQGHGQTNPNEVRVYDPTGNPTSVDFFAYAAGTWGTNVGAGDVNGAVYDEILTGPGPGPQHGPQVRAFDRTGAGLAKINYYAYGTLRYGVLVASGDVEGDGFDEIITGAGPGAVFGPHVRGWNFDNVILSPIARISFFAYGTLRYGVNVTTGDVEADGLDEMGTGPGPGPSFAAQVRGWNYDPATVGVSPINKINFIAFAGLFYGAHVAWGDVDADGYAELVATPGEDTANASRFLGFDYDAATVGALPGYDVTPFTTGYGGRVGLGDLLTNGSKGLITGAGPNPVATSEAKAYDYVGAALVPVTPTILPFTGGYGVNVAGGVLGY
ncbi:MAG: putative Ig domain-containing protein [Acidobacteriota bacterium]